VSNAINELVHITFIIFYICFIKLIQRMKTLKALFTVAALGLASIAFSQTYYVKGDADVVQSLVGKMIDLGQKVTTQQPNSEYTIDCSNILAKNPLEAQGFVMVTETKTGDIIAKSQSASASISSKDKLAGQSAQAKVAKKIADKYLTDMLAKCKKS
jgi:hypothetical protein